ncbi:MAG: CPXCG motif-containing cysteine-rich protein [Rhodanobacter sp.]
MLTPHTIDCPYCGEPVGILIDASIPSQHYIEDCQVCCRPITLGVEIGEDGEPQVRAYGENE